MVFLLSRWMGVALDSSVVVVFSLLSTFRFGMVEKLKRSEQKKMKGEGVRSVALFDDELSGSEEWGVKEVLKGFLVRPSNSPILCLLHVPV